jgi:hypothetical protein
MNHFFDLIPDLQEYIQNHKYSMVIQRSWRRYRDCIYPRLLLCDLYSTIYDEYYQDSSFPGFNKKFDLP